MSKPTSIISVLVATLLSFPAFGLRLFHLELDPPLTALITGAAILGVSFLLLWACDAAQQDISQALALAIVALIAVLPEYAVDMYFTWQAGQHPEGNYAHYAIANMTGANRLLIGVAWSLIAFIFWYKTRRRIDLEPERRTEVAFLGLATAYAFLIPLKGSLAWYDGIVFVGLFVWYITLASRKPSIESELHGPSLLLACLPKVKRRFATALMFLYSAVVILANAEPFSEGLVATGRVLGIDEFLLVQWLAPIASEAPEFTVAIMLALRGQAGAALGSLLSAKLNQWTLLVGMIPAVYGISSGSFEHPMPMSDFQLHEILLTAAQSLLAVSLLVSLHFSLSGAVLLLGLFVGQFMFPYLGAAFSWLSPWQLDLDRTHLVLSAVYLAAAVAILMSRRRQLAGLWHGLKTVDANVALGQKRLRVKTSPYCRPSDSELT